MKNQGLMFKLVAPMSGLVLMVALSGNEEADCTQVPDPEVECTTPVDCEGLPYDLLCLDGAWHCVNGECKYECEPMKLGCYSDQDCPDGTHCSVSDGDCGPDPSCPMCAVCYGECVPDKTECVQSGCSGEVCAEKAVYTPCLWQEWFECLALTACGSFGENGSCGFEQSDDFLACVAEKTGCTTDADCPEGFVCENDSWCGSEDSWCVGGGTCVPEPDPEGCETDADCLGYEFCDHSPWDEMVGCCVPLDANGTGCPEGYPVCPGECKMKPGLCWADSDCEEGQHCELMDCLDGMDCGAGWPGQCMDDQPLECSSEADCKPGQYCQFTCGNGWCASHCAPLPEGTCVKDSDCALDYLYGDVYGEMYCKLGPCPECEGCPCFGTCEMKGLPPGQCWTDADCEADEYCDMMKCDPATGEKCIGPYECKPKPVQGCLSDSDCESYEYCDFIVYDGSMDCCPPNAFCDSTIPPCEGGECRLLPGYCWEDADCAPGEKCEGIMITNCGDPTDPDANCGEEPWPGKCAAEGPECLSDDECPPGHVCVLETWCPPCTDEDPACLAPCYAEGHCEPAQNEKCFDDADCGTDQYCDFSGFLGECCLPGELCLMIYPPCEGVCKDKEVPPGECWTDEDCKDGEYCDGAFICPPDYACFAPDTPGKCLPVKEPECWSDEDCIEYEFCDKSASMDGCCGPDPACPDDPNLPPCPGVCKLKPGVCWSDQDCEKGEHCEGANICPPGAYCFAPDWPGECVPDQNECVAVKPNSHGACEMLLGVIFDGEKCVYESGCGCWPDCENIFDSFEECEKVCQPAPAYDCLADEDCSAGEYCDFMGDTGATICIDCDPTDPNCEPGCFPMGTCQAIPDGMCVKDADCQPWQKCSFIYPCPLCVGCPCFGVCEDLPD